MRAVDAAGNRGPATTPASRSRAVSPLPCPGPGSNHRLPDPTATRHRRCPESPGSRSPSSTSSTRSTRTTGALIPPEPDGLSGRQPSLERGRPPDHAPRGRNEFVAFQVLLRGEHAAWSGSAHAGHLTGREAQAIKVELGRYHPVTTKIGPLPDPIVPLTFPGRRPVRVTRTQSLHVEVYVPHDLPAGDSSRES